MSFLKTKYFSAPKVLQVEITNRCPYNCSECYKIRREEDMSFDVFKKIIDEAIEINVKSIMLNGGEPMISKNLKDMIRYVNRRIQLTIFTSGYNLDEKWVDFFVTHNIKIYISLNGSSDRINSLSREGYSTALTAMELLCKKEYPYYINWVARNDNVYDLPALIKLAKQMRATRINIVANKLTGNHAIRSPLTKKDYGFLIDTISSEKDYIISIQRCFGILIQEMSGGTATFLDGCQAGISACAVMLDGSYQPCTHLQYPERTGSILSYWNESSVLDSLRLFRTPSLTHCEKCSKNEVCFFCRAMSLDAHNDLRSGYHDCPLYEEKN